MSVESPCTGVCRIDPRTGWCEGCWRTLAEISEWGAAGDARRQAILDGLRPRRQRAAASDGDSAAGAPSARSPRP